MEEITFLFSNRMGKKLISIMDGERAIGSLLISEEEYEENKDELLTLLLKWNERRRDKI
jgi:hypothetical protein